MSTLLSAIDQKTNTAETRSNLLAPKLRFKEFKNGLKINKLDELVIFKSGGTPPKDNPLYWGGDIPWISATSMNGKYYSKSERTITLEGLQNGSKLAPKGSLLLLVRGSMLFNKIPIGITEVDVAFNQDLKALTTKENSNTEFLYQWFFSKQNLLLDKVGGTGIGAGKLDTEDLKNLDVHLPTLPEQQKIASFLSAVDEKIQQLTRKKELLDQYKKGVMQQLFSGELRFKPAQSEVEGDEHGKDFPDWEEKRLGEVSIVKMGQSPDSKSYNTESIGMLLIQGNADINGRVTNPRQWTSAPTKKCEIGDLILTVRAPVGSISKSLHNACIGRGVCSIKNNKFSTIEFLFQFLLSYEDKWKKIEQGSTFTAVNGNEINSIKLSMPSFLEQQKIATYLSSLDTKIENVTNQITQTQRYKKGLLQQLFV